MLRSRLVRRRFFCTFTCRLHSNSPSSGDSAEVHKAAAGSNGPRAFVGASEIAQLIGLTPYTTVAEAVQGLWEKNNRKTFLEALERNQLRSSTPEEKLKALGILEMAAAV